MVRKNKTVLKTKDFEILKVLGVHPTEHKYKTRYLVYTRGRGLRRLEIPILLAPSETQERVGEASTLEGAKKIVKRETEKLEKMLKNY